MAQLGQTYDASNGETMGDRSALPPGDYVIALVKSDQKSNDKGNSFVSCEFEVREGPDGVNVSGRRVWTNLNLWNSNAQAVEIAQRELNSIMHACGKLRIADTEELHGIPMRATIGLDKKDATRNQIKSYKPLNAAPGAQAGQAQGGGFGSQSSGSTGSAPPWKRGAA
jgi:hypothetical protein